MFNHGPRICVIKSAALGDVLRTTSLLPALKRQFEGCRITWLTLPEAAPMLLGNPYIDELLTFDEAERDTSQLHFDWTISLDDEVRPCLIAARIRCGKLSGSYSAAGEFPSFTKDMEPWTGMGYLRPASLGGIARSSELKQQNKRTHAEILYECLGLSPPVEKPVFVHVLQDIEPVDAWLKHAKLPEGLPVLGLNPGAARKWLRKSFCETSAVDASRKLSDELDAVVILTGGKKEYARNTLIAQQAARRTIITAPVLPLRSFFALISRLRLLVSTDSLAMHAAIACGTPVVAWFGPTSPVEIQFFDGGESVSTDLPCAHCYHHTCDISPACNESVDATRLVNAARKYLPV